MFHRQEYIRCGKGCSGCPHGPYWYTYFRTNGKLRKRYVGKSYSGVASPGSGPVPKTEIPNAGPGSLPKSHCWDAIFVRRTASADLACKILGVHAWASVNDIKAAYRYLVAATHPDKGGDTISCQRVVAAYTFLKAAGRG